MKQQHSWLPAALFGFGLAVSCGAPMATNTESADSTENDIASLANDPSVPEQARSELTSSDTQTSLAAAAKCDCKAELDAVKADVEALKGKPSSADIKQLVADVGKLKQCVQKKVAGKACNPNAAQNPNKANDPNKASDPNKAKPADPNTKAGNGNNKAN